MYLKFRHIRIKAFRILPQKSFFGNAKSSSSIMVIEFYSVIILLVSCLIVLEYGMAKFNKNKIDPVISKVGFCLSVLLCPDSRYRWGDVLDKQDKTTGRV